MQGYAGTMTIRATSEHAVQPVMSGPLLARSLPPGSGSRREYGTSFDVTLIRDGAPSLSAEKDIAYGMPVRVPMIDIHSIGAGGGSIARVNRAGILQVGPQSAGARPGPICYGRCGEEPTVTDANLLLDRLDPATQGGLVGWTDSVGLPDRPSTLGCGESRRSVLTTAPSTLFSIR